MKSATAVEARSGTRLGPATGHQNATFAPYAPALRIPVESVRMPAAVEFWEDIFAKGRASAYSRVEMPQLDDPILHRALAHFGDVRGRTVLDVGCGRGATSLFFAHHGAKVVSVDLSATAIDNLTDYCRANGIDDIHAVRMSAMDIHTLPPVDFVFGSMILHHLEPFADFAARLGTVLARGGKAFFWENNARSKTMIWFRQHVIGKLWIPKHGDPDEFPLTPAEVDELRKRFTVDVEYPELLLFRMIPRYLFRGHAMQPFEWLDRACFRFPALRQYSYRQYLYLR
jgi:2-polyprenyl-3-methyl-5-hydroxy-6-metoxy-1,4-benzoquinol methylase